MPPLKMPITLESFKDPNLELRQVPKSHSPFFRRTSIPSDVISKTTTPRMLRPSHRNADAFRFDTRPLTVAGGLIAVNLAGVKTLSIHRPFSGWFQWQGPVILPCVLSQQTPGGTYGNQTDLTPICRIITLILSPFSRLLLNIK